MSSMRDFGGGQLVVGAAYSKRCWQLVDDSLDGQLTLYSVTHVFRWHPGVNHAECYEEAHPVGYKGCTCGFYSYWYDKENEYVGLGYVEGIIRSTGHVTAGSHGLRSEKAEIVALIEPSFRREPPEPPKKSLWARFMEWVDRHGDGVFISGIAVFVVASVLGVTLAIGHDNPRWLSLLGFGLVAAVTVCVLAVCAMGYDARSTFDPLTILEYLKPTKEQWNALLKQYPAVKVYKSIEEAEEDFPMTFTPQTRDAV